MTTAYKKANDEENMKEELLSEGDRSTKTRSTLV